MIRFNLFALLVILLVCAACERRSGESAPSDGVKLDVLPPGIHQQTIQREDGTVLRFTISVPDGYSDGTPAPLVVALHYGGEVTPFYGRGVLEGLVAPALEELHPIVVAPDSIAGDWTSATNEEAVLQLIDSVIASYDVDTAKTLLTGYSMGGAGTWYIAGRHQERFSAAIPISGSPAGEADWKIPVYVIHSRADEVLPLAPTEDYVEQLKSEGCDVQLVIVEGITHYETARFAEPLREAIPWIRSVWE